MAEQFDTGAAYHLADNAGTDNSEYTLAEEVNGKQEVQRLIGEKKVKKGKEDEYKLVD